MMLFSCKNYSRIGSVRSNVCKALEKKTILYAVFVDSDATHPWSEYDIQSTLDSINVSIEWMEKQAKKNGIALDIQLEIGKNESKKNVIPFKEAFKYKTLSNTLFNDRNLMKGIKLVDAWSNNLAKDVARNLPEENTTVILTKNKLNNRERLIAKLRNQYCTDNIALIYFINNYFEDELSVAFHTENDTETEYAIVSDKNPAVIAHEFLHLFGAWDLYISPFERKIFAKIKKRKAMAKYPNEIMAFTHKNIDSLSISPLTKYLIGWESKLEKKDLKMIGKRSLKLLEY